MKSAYLFASILAPTCIFAQPLEHDKDKNPKPGFARDVLEKRSPQTADGNATSPFNDDVANITQPDDSSDSNSTSLSQFWGWNVSSGIQIYTYANAHCEGPHHDNITLVYGSPIAHQMQSYRLHHNLGPYDRLVAYADINWNPRVSRPVDPSLENNAPVACAKYAYNLTEKAKAGCHSLDTRVGCIEIGSVQDQMDGTF